MTRALGLIAACAIGCGSGGSPRHVDYPLASSGGESSATTDPTSAGDPGDPSDPSDPVVAGDPIGGGDGPSAAELAAADPATCMPAGEYIATFDYSDARFVVAGMDEPFCQNMAKAVAVQGKSAMTIERGDTLVVRWPEREAVIEQGGCGFEVITPPVRASFRFAAGRGVGTAAYAVGASNHPDERCEVSGVRVTIAPAP